MYDLWIASCVAALAVGVFVWGLIFWCVVRYRKRGNELPVQTRYNLPMEFLYTIAPVLIVSVLFYYTAVVQTDVVKTTNNPDVTVEVVAFKWNWQFNYRDGQGVDAETTASVLGTSEVIPILVLPTDRSIRFEETSRDVIHSFWVPEMLFKRDVMPGSIRNVFEVSSLETEGAYVGRCAELCGSYHAFMNFELRVVSPENFDRFLAAKQGGASTQEALTSIGEEPYATTTKPFETRRTESNFNPDTAPAGTGS
jgi:cytochrome c oxidase subunit II